MARSACQSQSHVLSLLKLTTIKKGVLGLLFLWPKLLLAELKRQHLYKVATGYIPLVWAYELTPDSLQKNKHSLPSVLTKTSY